MSLVSATSKSVLWFCKSFCYSCCARKPRKRIPWLLLFLDLCSANPECCEWTAHSSMHTNMCQFRTVTEKMFENTNQHIQLDKSSSTCVDFGLGRLSGFLRDLIFSVPSRVWYLLAFLAIQNLQRNLGDRICCSIHEQLQNLHKIPSDLRINRKQRPGHLLISSFALSFAACCCAREANSANWRKNRYTKKT